jgi:hypothetical protein
VTEIPQSECEALVALYNSTNGPGWLDNTNWLETTTPCSWYGVLCSGGHVYDVDLSSNQLSGTIHQNSAICLSYSVCTSSTIN